MRHHIRLVQLGAAPLVRIVSRSPAAVRHRTDRRRTCLASYGLRWASTLSPHRRHVEAVLHNAPGPTKDTDEAPGTDKATCSAKLQSKGEGGEERPQGQPPERRPRASGFVVNGVGVLEILTLPARHLVWQSPPCIFASCLACQLCVSSRPCGNACCTFCVFSVASAVESSAKRHLHWRTVTMAMLAVRFPAVWDHPGHEYASVCVQVQLYFLHVCTCSMLIAIATSFDLLCCAMLCRCFLG